MNWINVKDRLPDEPTCGLYGTVIVAYESGDVACLDFDYEKQKFWENGDGWNGCYRDDVTHWMPFPSAPSPQAGRE